MKSKLLALAVCMATTAMAQVGTSAMVEEFTSNPKNCQHLVEVIKTKSITGLPRNFVIDMDEAMDEIWQKGEGAESVMARLSNLCRKKTPLADS